MATVHTIAIDASTDDTTLAAKIAALPQTKSTLIIAHATISANWYRFPAACLQIFKYCYDNQRTTTTGNNIGFYVEYSITGRSWYGLSLFTRNICNSRDVLEYIFASVESFQKLLAPCCWYFQREIITDFVWPLCSNPSEMSEQDYAMLTQGTAAAFDFILTLTHLDIETLISYYRTIIRCPYHHTTRDPSSEVYAQTFQNLFEPRAKELVEFVKAKLRPVPDLQFVELVLETV